MWNEPDKKTYLASAASNMTGTSAIGGTALNVLGRGMAAFQCTWAGTGVGTFTVHGSNVATPSAAADWFLLGNVIVPRNPAGTDDNIVIKVPCATQWVKVTYTNASGTGALGITVTTTPFPSSVEVSSIVVPGVGVHGQNTDVDASAEQLTATSTPLKSGITVKALPGNSDQIYIGYSSAVTASNGYPLDADQSVFIEIDDVNKVWAIGGAANQGVSWIGS